MNTILLGRWKKNSLKYLQQGRFLDIISDISWQVNLLALISMIGMVTGVSYHFFMLHTNQDFAKVIGSLLGFSVVIILNIARKYNAANILYYVITNFVSLLILRSERTEFAGAILTYVFLFSLFVFLFEDAVVRVICMSLILIRIYFFEIHIKSSDPQVNLFSTGTGFDSLTFGNFALSLIILVFLFYGIKIYAVQKAQKRDALFVQHMTHDLQVSYSSVEFIISHLLSLIDPNETRDPKTLLIKKLSQASSFYAYIKRNFLEFSRCESGSIGINHLEEIDLATELEEIVGLYEPLANDKSIEIVLDIDDHLPQLIISDKIKVTRIVLNLLTNAINHSYDGKAITVTVRWENGAWRLLVANKGAEIPPERLQQIFNFYESPNAARNYRRLGHSFFYEKTEAIGNKRRLGLGLPITKQLVEALGGKISAASKKDRETLFTVAFPSQ